AVAGGARGLIFGAPGCDPTGTERRTGAVGEGGRDATAVLKGGWGAAAVLV
ncbi:hypothetical protein Tco_0312704, partial [Tanacetum coccineum]